MLPPLKPLDESKCSEGAVQAYCFMYAWNYLPELRYCLFAVPNGGRRQKIEGAQLKGMGVVAGITDCILLWEGKAYGLEFKTLKGKARETQLKCHAAWKKQGIDTYIIREFDPFQELIHGITGIEILYRKP